jgi:hypothetical protein
MNDHLYIATLESDGEIFMLPCVGHDELAASVKISEHCGARVVRVSDVEQEIKVLLKLCKLEGLAKRWALLA